MNQVVAGRPIEILLIADSPAITDAILDVFRVGKIHNALRIARNGAEARDLLRQHTEPVPRPDLIILDLDLRAENAGDLLTEIRADVEFRAIPIIVLTEHPAGLDHQRSRHLDGTYVTKPVALPQFLGAIESIREFSLIINTTNKGDAD